MGFWNKVGKIAGNVIENAPAIIEALQKEGAKKQAELHKRAENRISDYEKKVTLAAKSNKMNDPAYARKVHEEKEKIKKARINLYTGNSNIKTVEIKENGDVTFGGLTLSQWDSRWIYLGTLSSLSLENLQTYNKSIGLYKAEMNGEITYLGRAIEYNNGGFRKRLRDYVRNSDSARTHGSGKKMHESSHLLKISVLVVGDGAEDVDTVKALEKAMIAKHKVKWNIQHNL